MGAYKSEFVIALACAVGTDLLPVRKAIADELSAYGYQCQVIKISADLLEPLDPQLKSCSAYDRANRLMNLGNDMRANANEGSILAEGAMHQIREYRRTKNQSKPNIPVQGTAYIIDSLKHPDEVNRLREVYATGFYLFAINEAEQFRIENLNTKNIGQLDAKELITRDLEEDSPFGQKTRRVFELADFHLSLNAWKKIYVEPKEQYLQAEAKQSAKEKLIQGQVSRIIKLLFGNPFITPTFDEYAMFIAYSSGLRSADLSRQVGAAIASPLKEIIATGANDCHRFEGGQYWPELQKATQTYEDVPLGRDYKRGYDSNKQECAKIAEEIVDVFDFSMYGKDGPEAIYAEKKRASNQIFLKLKRLTEFGRPVHAEMSAILSCARIGISLKDATLYCSTFPCHNCAKHIISAGIKRVVYIEPYPKSKSVELFSDSLVLAETIQDSSDTDRVLFEEFVGIGPRRFYDLFSIGLSSGSPVRRKNSDDPYGKIINWDCQEANLRCIMAPSSYLDREELSTGRYLEYLKKKESE